MAAQTCTKVSKSKHHTSAESSTHHQLYLPSPSAFNTICICIHHRYLHLYLVSFHFISFHFSFHFPLQSSVSAHQHTHTPTHLHTNTFICQHIHTPTHQHTNAAFNTIHLGFVLSKSSFLFSLQSSAPAHQCICMPTHPHANTSVCQHILTPVHPHTSSRFYSPSAR